MVAEKESKILKDYLVKGFAVNNKIAAQKYDELCGRETI